MKVLFLVFSFLILFSKTSVATKVPSCEGKEDFFMSASKGLQIKNLEALPDLVYIGKRARYYIESKKHSFRLLANQSFIKGDTHIICSTPSRLVEKNFSLYAPALIDLTEENKVGNSFWQFHISVSQGQLGVWNQKTRMFNKVSDIEKAISESGLQLQIHQISPDEVEMIFSRESNDYFERLAIRYDIASSPR